MGRQAEAQRDTTGPRPETAFPICRPLLAKARGHGGLVRGCGDARWSEPGTQKLVSLTERCRLLVVSQTRLCECGLEGRPRRQDVGDTRSRTQRRPQGQRADPPGRWNAGEAKRRLSQRPRSSGRAEVGSRARGAPPGSSRVRGAKPVDSAHPGAVPAVGPGHLGGTHGVRGHGVASGAPPPWAEFLVQAWLWGRLSRLTHSKQKKVQGWKL